LSHLLTNEPFSRKCDRLEHIQRNRCTSNSVFWPS